MNKNPIIDQLKEVCTVNKISEEMKAEFRILSKQELIDLGGEGEKDSLYGDFDFVIMFSDFPDYFFIKKDDAISALAMRIEDWLEEINVIK